MANISRASEEELPGRTVEELPAFQVVVIGLDIGRGRLADRLLFLGQQADFELLDDGLGDFVLDRENVGQVPVVAVRPEVPAV